MKALHMSEDNYHRLVDKVENTYRPIIEALGKDFTVNRDWENDKVNAQAKKEGNNFIINTFGGLARFESMTDDAFLLVTCHEIGHLIGGAPTIKPFNIASSEGQADYFATLKCMRKVIRGENHKDIIGDSRLHPLVLSECYESFNPNNKDNKDDSEDYLICLRTSLANKAMARTFKLLGDLETLPKFDTPDPYERMFILFNGYPNAQCRLDTLLAGSICNADLSESVHMELYNKGVCSTPNGDTRGVRPRCWYVPREDEK